MKPDPQVFLRDVIDNASCPECDAQPPAPCTGEDLPADVPSAYGTHDARVKVRRDQMTDDDYARFGLKILESYAAVRRS